MPAGRPSPYKPEFCAVALEVLGAGGSRAALAAKLDVAKATIWDWERAHPEFSDAVARGLSASESLWESPDWHPDLHPARWKMNMTNRFGWTDRVENAHVGPGGGPIQTESKVSLDPSFMADLARAFLTAESLDREE